MKQPYLIQRMKQENSDEQGGIDANYRLDYMGSAEFEFGALPESLKYVTSRLSQYKEIVTDRQSLTNANGEPLRLFLPQGELDHGYIEALEKLAKDDISFPTKEAVKLDRGMKCDFDKLWGVDVWWDIENHVFFYFGEYQSQVLRQSLNNVKEKFQSQNRI